MGNSNPLCKITLKIYIFYIIRQLTVESNSKHGREYTRKEPKMLNIIVKLCVWWTVNSKFHHSSDNWVFL